MERYIPFGVKVFCVDGLYGISSDIILNPQERRGTRLIVQENFGLRSKRMLPISIVKNSD